MRVFLQVSSEWNPSRTEGSGDAFAGSLDPPYRFGSQSYSADSDNSCHANRGMFAALTASKLKHHKKVFAKRQDNALTASEFRAAMGSASRCGQIPGCHLQFHCHRPYDYCLLARTCATLGDSLQTVNLTAC